MNLRRDIALESPSGPAGTIEDIAPLEGLLLVPCVLAYAGVPVQNRNPLRAQFQHFVARGVEVEHVGASRHVGKADFLP